MQRIWYVAYGSNLSRERFCHYLRGGRPDGVERDYPGCRDTSDELASFGLLITGGIYFAGRSSGWRAGMAFYDPEAPGEVAARAYLITAEQFVDVLAQETLRLPGLALDLAPAFRGDRYSNGVGSYSVLVRVGERHGLRLVTFTRERRAGHAFMAPSKPYLTAMAIGLRQAHGWSEVQIDRYLSAIPGAAIPGAAQVIRRSGVRNLEGAAASGKKKWWIHLGNEVNPPLLRSLARPLLPHSVL